MRVTPPDALRIDRTELLEDVKQRLAERAPALVDAFDAAHPAWLVLEEAAWLVERFSEKLDAYPWAVVQQFAHLLGAQVQPALPAVGMVVLEPAEPGRLDVSGNPARWRIFASQTEERDLVEFALAENGVSLNIATLGGLARLRDGELHEAGTPLLPTDPLPESVRWFGAEERTNAFASETFTFHLRAADPDRVETELIEAIERLRESRDPGWLAFQVSRRADQQVVLTARVDVTLPRVVESDNDDVLAPWRPLDDSAWTPPVRVSAHPLLPPTLRRSRPLRTEDGQILIPGVPSTMLRNELLTRDARPAPAEIPELIWQTLVHLDRRLAGLEPAITRGLAADASGPGWVNDALRGKAWYAVESSPDQSLAGVDLGPSDAARVLRVAWIVAPGKERRPRAFARFNNSGLHPAALSCVVAWDLALPDPHGRGMVQVIALDIVVPPGALSVLLAIDGAARAVVANAAMIIDASVVFDGRVTQVTRAVPEPVSLLYEDIVTPAVIKRLGASGLSPSAAAVLTKMPCALVVIDETTREADFRGMGVDASQGMITMNAPDELGQTLSLRRGQGVELRWYRRTFAAQGNIEPHAINFIEQAPATRPRVVRASNPLATFWGRERERDEEAVLRVFGPQVGVPVTPADWERLIRVELGARGADWTVRVWTYAERTLLSHAVWPPHDLGPTDEERQRLEAALAVAGPDALLVVLGPSDGMLSEVDLDHARRVVGALVGRWADRLPTVQSAVVTRFWPVRVIGEHGGVLPAWNPGLARGVLVDALGRRSAVPDVALLLNAAIVGMSA